jgi:hypothetical protein
MWTSHPVAPNSLCDYAVFWLAVSFFQVHLSTVHVINLAAHRSMATVYRPTSPKTLICSAGDELREDGRFMPLTWRQQEG